MGLTTIVNAHHLPIISTVAGTVLLAFSVKVRNQYRGSIRKMLKGKREDYIQPTETTIVRWRFWLGLDFIALGAVIQW